MCAAQDMLRKKKEKRKKLKVRGSGKEKSPEMYPILGDLACCAFQEGFQEFRQ